MTNATGSSAPRASVVIPNFHGGELLREAIDSVRAQTLADWELIIVCDGSTDDLSDLERSDPRVRVFYQRIRGVSIARNVGIRHARSALVALLDDDDRMMPDRLGVQVAVMDDTSIGLCHTQFRLIDERGTAIGEGASRESRYVDSFAAKCDPALFDHGAQGTHRGSRRVQPAAAAQPGP